LHKKLLFHINLPLWGRCRNAAERAYSTPSQSRCAGQLSQRASLRHTPSLPLWGRCRKAAERAHTPRSPKALSVPLSGTALPEGEPCLRASPSGGRCREAAERVMRHANSKPSQSRYAGQLPQRGSLGLFPEGEPWTFSIIT